MTTVSRLHERDLWVNTGPHRGARGDARHPASVHEGAVHQEPLPVGRHVTRGCVPHDAHPVRSVGRFKCVKGKASDPTIPPALARLHRRLKNKVELQKLHAQHYTMNLPQLKARTSELALPKEVYNLYDQAIK